MNSFMGHLIRIPTSEVSCAVAKASLKLEYLSASFIVDPAISSTPVNLNGSGPA
jgi:hypothetical protein